MTFFLDLLIDNSREKHVFDKLFLTFSGEWSDGNCTVPSNVTNEFLGFERCKPEWIPGVENLDNCTWQETPAKQYWEKFVLHITPDIGEPGDLGGFNYPIPLALLLSWIVVFLCLMKGVKSSGKVRSSRTFALPKNPSNSQFFRWSTLLPHFPT